MQNGIETETVSTNHKLHDKQTCLL